MRGEDHGEQRTAHRQQIVGREMSEGRRPRAGDRERGMIQEMAQLARHCRRKASVRPIVRLEIAKPRGGSAHIAMKNLGTLATAMGVDEDCGDSTRYSSKDGRHAGLGPRSKKNITRGGVSRPLIRERHSDIHARMDLCAQRVTGDARRLGHVD